MYEYDRGLVFTSFDDAARLFRTGGEATGLRLAIPDLYNARDVAMAAATAARRTSAARNFYIDDWTRLHYTFFRSIQLQKSMMFVILSLVIAVAAFNIVSTLMMVVRDKRGDIAILRSFGTTQRSVMTLFASQGTFIGVIGTLLGVLLALLDLVAARQHRRRAARLGSASICCRPRCITWRTCRRRCGRSRSCRSAAWRWRSPSPPRSIRR